MSSLSAAAAAVTAAVLLTWRAIRLRPSSFVCFLSASSRPPGSGRRGRKECLALRATNHYGNGITNPHQSIRKKAFVSIFVHRLSSSSCMVGHLSSSYMLSGRAAHHSGDCQWQLLNSSSSSTSSIASTATCVLPQQLRRSARQLGQSVLRLNTALYSQRRIEQFSMVIIISRCVELLLWLSNVHAVRICVHQRNANSSIYKRYIANYLHSHVSLL